MIDETIQKLIDGYYTCYKKSYSNSNLAGYLFAVQVLYGNDVSRKVHIEGEDLIDAEYIKFCEKQNKE
jgi:hypothetical protein